MEVIGLTVVEGVGTSNSKHPEIDSAKAATVRAKTPRAPYRDDTTGSSCNSLIDSNFIIHFNL